MDFKIGDVVELRSGDQAMTVTGADQNSVDTVWIARDGQVVTWSFHPKCLKMEKKKTKKSSVGKYWNTAKSTNG